MNEIIFGEFLFGSSELDELARVDEVPAYHATIQASFLLATVPVTQNEFESLMEVNPSRFLGDQQRPVEGVTWYEALEFCNRLSLVEERDPYYELTIGSGVRVLGGEGYRLPTEMEWEYACRGGQSSRFCFGDDIESLVDYAWYRLNSGGMTHPVASKKSNKFGIYDMHGNVWEWCHDVYRSDIHRSLVDGVYSPETETTFGSEPTRVLRGGAYDLDAGDLRCAARDRCRPDRRNKGNGFRLARSI